LECFFEHLGELLEQLMVGFWASGEGVGSEVAGSFGGHHDPDAAVEEFLPCFPAFLLSLFRTRSLRIW
jgi:hypothetical protein